MKKYMALLLVLVMIFSLCSVPVTGFAEDAAVEESATATVAPTEADEVVFTDTFEKITENLLYPTSASPEKGGINALAITSGSYSFSGNNAIPSKNASTGIASGRVGVMKSSDTTNTIQFTALYDDTGSRNVAPYYTLDYWYNQEGYDTLVLGSKIPATETTDADGNTVYTGTYTTDSEANGYKLTGSPFKGAYLKAVPSPTNENDKVLEYNFGTTTKNFDCWTNMKSLTAKFQVGETKNYVGDGRKIAYSWNIYVPKGVAPYYYSRANISLGGIGVGTSYLLNDRAVYTGGKLYYRVYGYELDDTARATQKSTDFELTTDVWHTLTQVVTYDGDAYPVVSVYLDGEKVVDYASNAAMESNTNGYYTGDIQFKCTPHYNSAATEDFHLYVDDVMQYYIKNDITVSGLQDSYAAFTAKDTITLEYSSPIDFDALESAISVTKDGADAGVTATVAEVNPYTAEIAFSGLDTTVETTYQLNISKFADIYGIESAGKTATITTKQAGKLSVSTSVSEVEYELGTNSYITVTTDEAADFSGVKFYLEDSSGERIELTPTVSTDSKSATLNLYDAALSDTSAYYTLVSEGAFKSTESEAANSDIISIPVKTLSYVTLFNETFDTGYTDAENWLTTATPDTDDGTENGAYLYKDGAWKINGNADADTIEVVNAPEGFGSGKALHVKSGTTSEFVVVRRNFNGKTGISLTNESSAYYGKKIVYEADVIFTAGPANDQSLFMSPVFSEKKMNGTTATNGNWTTKYDTATEPEMRVKGSDSTLSVISGGYYENTLANSQLESLTARRRGLSAWNGIASTKLNATAHHITVSVDQSQKTDTYRVYVDGEPIGYKIYVHMDYPGHVMDGKVITDFSDQSSNISREHNFGNTFFGIVTALSSTSSRNGEMYIDNFKAYAADPFDVVKVTGANQQFNTELGSIECEFNAAVDTTSAASGVVVVDADGNVVEDAIESITFSDNDRKMTIKLNSSLDGDKNYTVKLMPELHSKLGMGLTIDVSDEEYVYTKTYQDAEGQTVTVTFDGGTALTEADYNGVTGIVKTEATDGTVTYTAPDLSGYVISNEYNIEIKTSKSTSLFATATAAVEGDTVKADVQFGNAANESKTAWYIIAAYGEYNEMLGCVTGDITNLASGATQSVTPSFTVDDGTKIKSVKIFVWDGYKTMLPYQSAEKLYPASAQ